MVDLLTIGGSQIELTSQEFAEALIDVRFYNFSKRYYENAEIVKLSGSDKILPDNSNSCAFSLPNLVEELDSLDLINTKFEYLIQVTCDKRRIGRRGFPITFTNQGKGKFLIEGY